MNNLKSLSIILLLSMGLVGTNYAGDCSSDCSTSNNCNTGCSTDCNTNNCSTDCGRGGSGDGGCRTSTYFSPRPLTTNLTYLNNLSFYNRYHEARCSFLTWDSTVFYQKSRRPRIGEGFLGTNNLIVGEQGTDIDFNSINLGLGNTTSGENFLSTVSLCPRREVIGWQAHLYFNLDCFCIGLWADIAFTVAQAKHRLRFNEVNTTPGNIPDEPTTVGQAFDQLNVFACRNGNSSLTTTTGSNNCNTDCRRDCKHTGVDDVLLRIGYDYNYCDNDHVGVYFLGIAPTGKHQDNTRWFQPQVGSKHGAVGVGFEGDYTIWSCENQDLVVQTELLYQYRLRHHECRVFDYCNGPLSRFLLVANADNVDNPVSGYDALKTRVRVEGRSQLNWWLNLHYQWCNWGAEISYELWFRDREKISNACFDFGNTGIFDMTHCGTSADPLTSHSTATIASLVNTGTADTSFVPLQSSDVNLRSGAAQRVLTNSVTGNVSYNGVWCDCYAWYVGLGGGAEFASRRYRRNALETWTVYGKWGISW